MTLTPLARRVKPPASKVLAQSPNVPLYCNAKAAPDFDKFPVVGIAVRGDDGGEGGQGGGSARGAEKRLAQCEAAAGPGRAQQVKRCRERSVSGVASARAPRCKARAAFSYPNKPFRAGIASPISAKPPCDARTPASPRHLVRRFSPPRPRAIVAPLAGAWSPRLR